MRTVKKTPAPCCGGLHPSKKEGRETKKKLKSAPAPLSLTATLGG